MEMRGEIAISRVAEQAIRNVNLPRNVAKSTWKHISKRRLFVMLLVEVWELFKALHAYHKACWMLNDLNDDFAGLAEYEKALAIAREEVEAARDAIRYEAGDCVAFVAFIVDKL